MNEENKYYVPKIEEFHIGFQFEDYFEGHFDIENSKKYSNEIFTNKTPFDYIEQRIKNNKIRVKFLDKEDIESLGFTLIKTFPSPYTKKELYSFKLNKEEGFNTGSNYYITFNDANINIEIQTYGSYDTFKYQMNFIIKNKSELIKILKMIGINE